MSGSVRTGILGGTFDPIHVGHLAVADAAYEALGLDEVMVMPSNVPPHRSIQPAAAAKHRLAMAELACAGRTGFRASDLELTRSGPTFTADTLRSLQASGREPWQLFFITGADAFAEIAAWRDYPAVVSLANFAIVSRPGLSVRMLASRLPDLSARMRMVENEPATAVDDHDTRVYLIDRETPDVSSTGIRQRVLAGDAIDGLVTASVSSYIHRHGLYRSPVGPVGSSICGR